MGKRVKTNEFQQIRSFYPLPSAPRITHLQLALSQLKGLPLSPLCLHAITKGTTKSTRQRGLLLCAFIAGSFHAYSPLETPEPSPALPAEREGWGRESLSRSPEISSFLPFQTLPLVFHQLLCGPAVKSEILEIGSM